MEKLKKIKISKHMKTKAEKILVMRNKFKIGELVLVEGKLPDKWKCTDI